MREFDLAIIGSGSAAFAAAIRARDAGASVVIVERGTVGGTCVNTGCVPSKTLLRAAEIRAHARKHPFPGITTSADGVDLAALVAQKDALVATLRQRKYLDLLAEYGIELVQGDARFLDPDTIAVDDAHIRASRVLIATGARPTLPAIPGLVGAAALTSTTALALERVPERLLVIGAGYVALELGQLFAHLGSSVALIARSTLMREEEPEVAETIRRVLTDDGIRLAEHATVERIEHAPNGEKTVHAVINGERHAFVCDELLVATGRTPNTETLDLEAASIETDTAGAIVVTPSLQTSNQRVYAAGDVVSGSPAFVYVAARMGATAASNALNDQSDVLDYAALPRVVFTTPQIARTGLTDAEAKRRGIDCSCRTLPLDALPRALANHDTRGFVKLVINRETRRLLGATIVADGAADTIQAAIYAIELDATIEQLASIWAPYLTYGEGLRLAAQTFTRDISKLSCCAA